jgi:uncharacterized membrane protein YhaH (DUF805 family)
MNWYIKAIKQYADFGGRAGRKEYWMFVMFNCIFFMAAIVADTALAITLRIPSPVLSLTYITATVLPALAVTVRRLHDAGKSGWWLTAGLTVIGGVWILALLLECSSKGDTRYGAEPGAAPQSPGAASLLRSCAVAMIVAATVWFAGRYFGEPSVSFAATEGIAGLLMDIVEQAASLLLLFIGILLIPRKSLSSVPVIGICRRAAAAMAVFALLRLSVNIRDMSNILTYGYVTGALYWINHCGYMLLNVAILLLAIALRRTDMKHVRAASVAMASTAVAMILVNIASSMIWGTLLRGSDLASCMTFCLSFVPVYPVALTALAGACLSGCRQSAAAASHGVDRQQQALPPDTFASISFPQSGSDREQVLQPDSSPDSVMQPDVSQEHVPATDSYMQASVSQHNIFLRKSAAPAAIYPPATDTDGVCEVCGCPLGESTARAVPGSVFYESQKWRTYFKSIFETATDDDIEHLRSNDGDRELPVCENCIYLFLDTDPDTDMSPQDRTKDDCGLFTAENGDDIFAQENTSAGNNFIQQEKWDDIIAQWNGNRDADNETHRNDVTGVPDFSCDDAVEAPAIDSSVSTLIAAGENTEGEAAPAIILFIRDSRFIAKNAYVTVTLNGKKIGVMGNKSFLICSTEQEDNLITLAGLKKNISVSASKGEKILFRYHFSGIGVVSTELTHNVEYDTFRNAVLGVRKGPGIGSFLFGLSLGTFLAWGGLTKNLVLRFTDQYSEIVAVIGFIIIIIDTVSFIMRLQREKPLAVFDKFMKETGHYESSEK